MNEDNNELLYAESVKKDPTFIESLAQYYSDFLATDFKKGSL